MEKFEQKENKEYKSDSTKFHEQKAEEERKNKKLMEKNEKLKKELDDLAI